MSSCSDNMPLISVIVPIYNAEKYLPQCLDSILNQTYRNLEIVCVNDGSTDGSFSVLSEYAKRDSRIIVKDKINGGVSKARNMGLDIITGEYVLFVDADDWLEPDTCEQAFDAMSECDCDVVLWSYVSERKGAQSFKQLFAGDRVFDEGECRDLLHRRFVGIIGEELAHPELADSLCPVWGKLYKRDLIADSGVRFTDLSEIGTYEDGLFNLEVFGFVKKAVYLDKCFYHYRRNNEDSATSRYNPNLFDQWQTLFGRMNKYIADNDLPKVYKDALYNRIAMSILGLGLNIMSADVSCAQKMKMLKEVTLNPRYIKSYNQLSFQYLPFHWKVFYWCAKKRFSVGICSLLFIISNIIAA